MAERNDVRTLEIGNGLAVTSPDPKVAVIRLTLTDETLSYLGTTVERLMNGKDKLVEQFDFSEKHKQPFLGLGKKFEK